MMKTAKTNSMLTLQQSVKLGQWLSDNIGRVENRGAEYAARVVNDQSDIGFTVSISNIRSAASAFGILEKINIYKRVGSGKGHHTVAQLSEMVFDLKGRVKTLEEILDNRTSGDTGV